MAYLNSSRATHLTLADRLGALLAGLRAAALRRQIYNRTLHELSNLSDRELADLGMHRSTISETALQAAYGA